jgi:hypothetical protein
MMLNPVLISWGFYPFCNGIADSVSKPAQDVLDALADYLGHFLDGLESAAAGPTVPVCEEFLDFLRIPTLPEPAEWLFMF